MIRYNPRGLSPNEVAESRRQHGDNVITPPKDDSVWKLLADKFRDPIIRILLLAAVLSLAIGFVHKDFTESIGIICAIILATCVGFWFEWDAMRRFRRLNQVNDVIPVKVMRDGAMHEVPRRDVVVGDVVYVESGETVPVDGELVEAVSLRINESTLTGELEVDKTVDEAHFDPDATYPSNVVLRGTTVADGYGVMVSTAVGDATEAGRVTEQSTVQTDEPPPLDRQLTLAGCDDRRALPFHKMLLNGELPLTMGGGIGQSRLCMLLLGSVHIGEVPASVWDTATRAACAKAGIPLL